jgi:hypothetical protein
MSVVWRKTQQSLSFCSLNDASGRLWSYTYGIIAEQSRAGDDQRDFKYSTRSVI